MMAATRRGGGAMRNKGSRCYATCTRVCGEAHGDRGGRAAADAASTLAAAPSFIAVVAHLHLTGSKFLRIPAAFMGEHGHRVGDSATLRGPTGFECRATIGYDKGFVFRAGFASFAAWHNLEAGDHLLFTLAADSDFQVKVYNKLGCEKVQIEGKGLNTRSPTAEEESPDKKKLRGGRRSRGAERRPTRGRSQRLRHHDDDDESAMQATDSVEAGAAASHASRKRRRQNDEVAAHDRDGVKKRRRVDRNPARMPQPAADDSGDDQSGHESEKQRARVFKLLRKSSPQFPDDNNHHVGSNKPPVDAARHPTLFSQKRARVRNDKPLTTDSDLDMSLPERPARAQNPQTISGPTNDHNVQHRRRRRPRAEPVSSNSVGSDDDPPSECQKERASSLPATMHETCPRDPTDRRQVGMGDNSESSAGEEDFTAEKHHMKKVRRGLTLEEHLMTLFDVTQSRSLEEAVARQLAAAAACTTYHPTTTLHVDKMSSAHAYADFPRAFAKKWFSATTRRVLLTSTKSRQRRWPVLWSPQQSRLGSGWRTFVKENRLKDGDVCVLELVNPVAVEFAAQFFRIADFYHGIPGAGVAAPRSVKKEAPGKFRLAPRDGPSPAAGGGAAKGWQSEGDQLAGAAFRATRTRCASAEHVKWPSDTGRFKYCSEDTSGLLATTLDARANASFLPTAAARFFANGAQTGREPDEENRQSDASTHKDAIHETHFPPSLATFRASDSTTPLASSTRRTTPTILHVERSRKPATEGAVVQESLTLSVHVFRGQDAAGGHVVGARTRQRSLRSTLRSSEIRIPDRTPRSQPTTSGRRKLAEEHRGQDRRASPSLPTTTMKNQTAGAPKDRRRLSGLETFARGRRLKAGNACAFELLQQAPLTLKAHVLRSANGRPTTNQTLERRLEDMTLRPAAPGHSRRVPESIAHQGARCAELVGASTAVRGRSGEASKTRRRPARLRHLARAIQAAIRSKGARIRGGEGRTEARRSSGLPDAAPERSPAGGPSFPLTIVKIEPVVSSLIVAGRLSPDRSSQRAHCAVPVSSSSQHDALCNPAAPRPPLTSCARALKTPKPEPVAEHHAPGAALLGPELSPPPRPKLAGAGVAGESRHGEQCSEDSDVETTEDFSEDIRRCGGSDKREPAKEADDTSAAAAAQQQCFVIGRVSSL